MTDFVPIGRPCEGNTKVIRIEFCKNKSNSTFFSSSPQIEAEFWTKEMSHFSNPIM